MFKTAFRFVARCTVSLFILIFGYGWLAPWLISAANSWLVVLGFFLLPFIPFVVWLVWKASFRDPLTPKVVIVND